MGQTFKVGDRVKFVGKSKDINHGESGIVVTKDDNDVSYLVQFSHYMPFKIWSDELALLDCPVVESRKPPLEALGGTKHDAGKPDLSLLPFVSKMGIARALMFGQNKYGRYNYLKGMDWSRLIAAADRHLSAFNDGEDVDPVDPEVEGGGGSGLNHLYHAGACIMMLIEYYEKELGNDNRKTDKNLR